MRKELEFMEAVGWAPTLCTDTPTDFRVWWFLNVEMADDIAALSAEEDAWGLILQGLAVI